MRQKRRYCALSHGPKILLLDEPTGALMLRVLVWYEKLVRKLGDEGGTVIYSTHNLAEAQQVCDRIIIIHNGTIRAQKVPRMRCWRRHKPQSRGGLCCSYRR